MSNIREGDLVMVVRPMPCGCSDSLGKMFVVAKIRYARKGSCSYCRQKRHPKEIGAETPWGSWGELSRLKKIPPLEEPTHHEHTETA